LILEAAFIQEVWHCFMENKDNLARKLGRVRPVGMTERLPVARWDYREIHQYMVSDIFDNWYQGLNFF